MASPDDSLRKRGRNVEAAPVSWRPKIGGCSNPSACRAPSTCRDCAGRGRTRPTRRPRPTWPLHSIRSSRASDRKRRGRQHPDRFAPSACFHSSSVSTRARPRPCGAASFRSRKTGNDIPRSEDIPTGWCACSASYRKPWPVTSAPRTARRFSERKSHPKRRTASRSCTGCAIGSSRWTGTPGSSISTPRETTRPVYDAYVIDCVPEREDLGCLQLITSTANLEEVRNLLDVALDRMGLSRSRRNAEFLLEHLKALSGRLAIRLTGNKPPTSELIALAVSYAHCRRPAQHSACWVSLEDGFIVPVDDVLDLLPPLPGGRGRRREGSPAPISFSYRRRPEKDWSFSSSRSSTAAICGPHASRESCGKSTNRSVRFGERWGRLVRSRTRVRPVPGGPACQAGPCAAFLRRQGTTAPFIRGTLRRDRVRNRPDDREGGKLRFAVGTGGRPRMGVLPGICGRRTVGPRSCR